jgi:hypothetical protein
MTEDVQGEARGWLAELEAAVALLHADAVDQQRWLEDFFDGQPDVVVDELALQFDDRWMEGQIVYSRMLLSEGARRRLEELDQALSTISGSDHAGLWTPEALASSKSWAHIRSLAGAALDPRLG